MHPERIVYICDWLPPDYGAVGQYSALFARELAAEGNHVVLVGLSSRADSDVDETVGDGRLRQVRLRARAYAKTAFWRRLLWTAITNTRIVWRARQVLRDADVILFTGSPPYLLHWLAPLNVLLRKRLVYRITDFHPECLIAQQGRAGPLLDLVYRLTVFWRRRVHAFEVLGFDQRDLLLALGIPDGRIRLKRDPSPVEIRGSERPLARPLDADGRLLLLYSGNWGVAHDYGTFVSAYERHHREGSGRILLWLNAVGAAVPAIERELARRRLPFVRGEPVPLDELARLLVTPDAHLITLSDAFVGLVLPSKVHGCIASQRPVLFVGSERSDVHLLCEERMHAPYIRVDVGDVAACSHALERLADLAAGRAAAPRQRNQSGTDMEEKRW